MPYTGVNFKQNWERRIDKPFNDYYDLDTLKDFFSRVLTLGIKEIYDTLDLQRRFDYLRSMLVFGRELNMTSNRILLQQLAISGYNSTTGQFTSAFKHNLNAGESISVLIAGNSASFDGELVVSSVDSEYKFTAPPQAIGAFVSGYIEAPLSILDYLHYDSSKVKYKVPSPVQIDTIFPTPSSIEFTTKTYSALRTGSQIFISGFTAPSNANGTFYVMAVGERRYRLYSDKNLLTPVSGNAKFSGNIGQLFTIMESEALFQSKPDQIQTYDKPSYQFPRWKMDENALVIEPGENLVSSEISFISKPKFVIDPEDEDTDLLLYIPMEFIEFLIDKGAALFDLETKDVRSLNMDAPQVVMNK